MRYEVIRHYADGINGNEYSNHMTLELAHKAFTKAVDADKYYAVDVCEYKPFNPLYGVANGHTWKLINDEIVWN